MTRTETSEVPRRGGPEAMRLIDSQELFGGEQEVRIIHAGETYRLRITRQGKLILNK